MTFFFSETKHEMAKRKMHLQNHQKETSNWEGPSKMMCCEYEIVSKLFLSFQENWFNVNHKLPSTKYSKHFNVTYLTSHKNLVSQFKIRNHIVVESCFQNGHDFFSFQNLSHQKASQRRNMRKTRKNWRDSTSTHFFRKYHK